MQLNTLKYQINVHVSQKFKLLSVENTWNIIRNIIYFRNLTDIGSEIECAGRPKNIAGAENYKFRKNIIVFILRKSYLKWFETIFDGILCARNLICTFITYFRVAEANMGGVIWHKPCLLTNFQSISFFPVLLETKGFLPALPPKSFLIWTP